MKKNENKQYQQQGPYDDVEYSAEVADAEDKEAMARMNEADKRAEKQRNQ
ncbi:YfhD family protein [Alkalihalophilus sp. As8PL]|uniref:YfhD family protein n=2 Tax=Alkalihalophilus TaxID=2893060 RepID=A0AB39BY45_9BACI|nr:YfhD family protein [Alkalihalophilus lindianensis]MDV2686208.1 YfhD family protein [Alkalihalophilus lindianensis]